MTASDLTELQISKGKEDRIFRMTDGHGTGACAGKFIKGVA